MNASAMQEKSVWREVTQVSLKKQNVQHFRVEDKIGPAVLRVFFYCIFENVFLKQNLQDDSGNNCCEIQE